MDNSAEDLKRKQINKCDEMKREIDSIRGVGDRVSFILNGSIPDANLFSEKFKEEFQKAERAISRYMELANDINVIETEKKSAMEGVEKVEEGTRGVKPIDIDEMGIPEIQTDAEQNLCKYIEEHLNNYEITSSSADMIVVKLTTAHSSEYGGLYIDTVTFYGIKEDPKSTKSNAAVFQSMSVRATNVCRMFREHYPTNSATRFLNHLTLYSGLFESVCVECGKYLFYESPRHGLLPPTIFAFTSGEAYHSYCYSLRSSRRRLRTI